MTLLLPSTEPCFVATSQNLRGYTWGKSKNTLASLQLIQALTTEAAALITLAEMTQAAAAAATATAELAGIAAATVAGSSSSTDPRHAWVSVALQDYATALRLQQQQKSQQATAELASEAAAVALQFGLLCNRLLQVCWVAIKQRTCHATTVCLLQVLGAQYAEACHHSFGTVCVNMCLYVCRVR